MRVSCRLAFWCLICAVLAGTCFMGRVGGHAAAHARPVSQTSAPIDSIYFGTLTSEAAHHLAAAHSAIINGGLGQTARLLLPLHPASIYGGTVSFTMRVSPIVRNYITMRYWGNDRGEALGRLLLYCNGQQVGYRFMSDYGLISGAENAGSESLTPSRPFPGRFFYVTEPLPQKLTRGKTSVRLTVQAIGYDWMYAATFAQYQHKLRRPSRGIYAAWISASPYFALPDNSPRGVGPVAPRRPGPGRAILRQLKFHVNSVLRKMLLGNSPDGPQRLEMLARAYTIPWCAAYNRPAVIARIVRDIDALACGKGQHSEANISWRLYGPIGRAIMLVHKPLVPYLNKSITLVDGKRVLRRMAWAKLLTRTIAYEQTHQRFYTNQVMIVNYNIYTANRGLEILEPSLAMPEKKALWYLYEAIGLVPFRGNKLAHGWQWPFGHHYYLVTKAGLSRELGYVASYGETITHFLWQMSEATGGNPKINAQLIKMIKARGFFMQPGTDHSGYRAMRLEGVIGWRHNLYPEEVCYGDRNIQGFSLECAALPNIKSRAIVGYAQQCLRDNQFFQSIVPLLNSSSSSIIKSLLQIPQQYAAVIKLPATGVRLPMTPGQKNVAWADPQDGVVAVKQGHLRLYASLYYRAYAGINALARIHFTTPTVDRLVRCHEQVKFTPSGQVYIRPDDIDQLQFHGFIPPNSGIHEAYAGGKMPIPVLPRGYIKTAGHYGMFRRGHYGPYLGRAGLYVLRYGPWIIGMNCSRHHEWTFTPLKGDRQDSRDLISGKLIKLDQILKLSPRRTVIFLLHKRRILLH